MINKVIFYIQAKMHNIELMLQCYSLLEDNITIYQNMHYVEVSLYHYSPVLQKYFK